MKRLPKFLILILFLSSRLTAQNESSRALNFSIHTKDIENFYNAFDLAIKDTANATTIFDKKYFKKGSKGLKDFYKAKIKDKEIFAERVLKDQEFYTSIKNDLMKIQSFNDTIIRDFKKFKNIYPNAISGDIYFVIGRLNSNGTISRNGLIIGAEVLSKTWENSNSWRKELKSWVLNFDHIPVTVFHEMIHFNQKGMNKQKNLLSYALAEGSAEFLTELFKKQPDGNYSKFKNRELIIWNDFKKEMYLDVYDNWHDDNEPLRPMNALYWAGYLICKSYYEQATDKKQAVYDILNIKNNTEFYNASKVEEYLNKNYNN